MPSTMDSHYSANSALYLSPSNDLQISNGGYHDYNHSLAVLPKDPPSPVGSLTSLDSANSVGSSLLHNEPCTRGSYGSSLSKANVGLKKNGGDGEGAPQCSRWLLKNKNAQAGRPLKNNAGISNGRPLSLSTLSDQSESRPTFAQPMSDAASLDSYSIGQFERSAPPTFPPQPMRTQEWNGEAVSLCESEETGSIYEDMPDTVAPPVPSVHSEDLNHNQVVGGWSNPIIDNQYENPHIVVNAKPVANGPVSVKSPADEKSIISKAFEFLDCIE